MNPRDVARIALRLMGLVYLVDAAAGAPQWIAMMTVHADQSAQAVNYDPRAFQAAALASMAVYLAFGLLCLLATERLVGWLFSDLREGAVTADARPLLPLGIRLIGVYVGAWSAIEVVKGAVTVFWYLGGERREYLSSVAEREWFSWLYGAVGVVLGLALFYAANRLSAAVSPAGGRVPSAE